MATTPGKDVAKAAPAGAVVAHNYGEHAGAGLEGQDSSHLSIPFLNLLQALSPQLEDENLSVKAGMLFNSVTNDAYDGKTGVEFVPAHIDHLITEWVPKEKGGGWVGVHDLASDIVVHARETSEDRNKLRTTSGNDLVETFYMYGIVVEDETPVGMAVIAFTSTKIKSYKAWNTKRQMFPHRKFGIVGEPPLFAHRIRLTSVKQKNAKGEFYNFVLTPAVGGDIGKSLLAPDSDCLVAAMQVRDMVKGGQARAAFETADNAVGESAPPF